MADMTTADTAIDPCCAPEQQATCCEPSAKADCCARGANCDCEQGTKPMEAADVREEVRERYAAAARTVAQRQVAGTAASSCCSPALSITDASGEQVFGGALYDSAEAAHAPDSAVAASLGCGVPTAVAALREGNIVLDLGSGAGADVLISARRVGASGKAIGLDMTDEMLELARSNAEKAGAENVEFYKGYIEEIPLPDASVDVVISNCVLNLSGDKPKVMREAARALRPGGRFAISDVIADEDMDDATRADMQKWTGCIAGALTRREFELALGDAGLVDIEISETHRVHDQAASAIIRARKPTGPCA
ncbi:MAG TPA: arsenite methyltransferase [Solirubrobacteraceae bacterium]|nr:arsenite methyltransferase [Solirubrobacteraceae bacterium]